MFACRVLWGVAKRVMKIPTQGCSRNNAKRGSKWNGSWETWSRDLGVKSKYNVLVTSKSSCLFKQSLCCCLESLCAPAWRALTSFPSRAVFPRTGASPSGCHSPSASWETLGSAGQKALWAASLYGWSLGRAGWCLSWVTEAWLSPQLKLGVTGVPSTIALPWVTMGSLESLKFLLKQRIVTLWLLCSAASWWYSVIKSILWFWLSEGSNSEEKLFLGGCVFVCLLFWLPFGCFWPSLCCVFFNKNLLPWLVVEQI